MSKVRLTGTTSGFTELTAPAVAGSNTITLPSGNGTADQRLVTNGSGALSFTSDVMLAAGSAGSPSLYFSGDTNTGMWSPTADTLAWSTGGTERMRIRSDGNAGIGSAGSSGVRVYAQGSDTTLNNWAYYGVNSTGTQLFGTRNDGAFNTGIAALSPYFLTTGVAANVFVDAGGYLYRSTSSARFKTDIETLEDSYADALLDVRPVWYRSIAPGDTTHPDWGYWGFIAEEVAEIDPRLVFWKTHETQKDEDGNDIQVELKPPLVEGVQYDRFIPHLLNLIKRQNKRIEALEARITALEVN